MKQKHLSIAVIALAIVLLAVLLIVMITGLIRKPQKETIEGQVETTEYRVSSKIPSRVAAILVKEGDKVRRGDTLAIMEAPDIEAKLAQAHAAFDAAKAIEEKARNGARQEDIRSAYELWQKAKAALEVAEKTFHRVDRLFQEGVLAEQKRDEAKAQYDAMTATEKAAKAQYDMAVKGARTEDRHAASAQTRRAEGAIAEVSSYINETVLLASADGQVTDIFPQVGELVGSGAPIMNISVTDDVWFTFYIREDLLKHYRTGTTCNVHVPAIDQDIPVKITLMKDAGSFAVWKATKALDDIDLKTFEVQARPLQHVSGLHAGMSAVLDKP